MFARIAVCTLVVLTLSGTVAAQWTWTPETRRFVRMQNLPKESPELQVEHVRSLMIGGEYKKAFEESQKFERFYGDTEFADENQFLRGEIRYAQGDYRDAATEYQSVVSNYPGTDRYDDVIERQYDIGDQLFEIGERRFEKRSTGFRPWQRLSGLNPFKRRPLKDAIDVYSMVIDNQPFTPEAAEAQYKIGRSHFARDEYLEASFEFRRVLEDYSNSEWVREASHDLTRSYEEMSLTPEYDQAPSQLAIDTIDDFVRRYPDDPRVEDRLDVKQEMRERIAEQRLRTAEFYARQLEQEPARTYYEIAAYEFGDTEAGQEAQEWLESTPLVRNLQSQFIGDAVTRAERVARAQ